MKTLTPSPGYLVVRPVPEEDQTETGLYIASTAVRSGVDQGEVVVSSKGYSQDGQTVRIELEPEDQILYTNGTEIEFNGEALQVVHASRVLATVRDVSN